MISSVNQPFTKEEYIAPETEIILFDRNDSVMDDIGISSDDPFSKIFGNINLDW